MRRRGLRADGGPGAGPDGGSASRGGRSFRSDLCTTLPALAALASLGLALACRDAPEAPVRLALVQHLVDGGSHAWEGEPGSLRPLAQAPEPGGLPHFERIAREARPVLRGFPLVRSERRPGAAPTADADVLSARFPLPAAFADYASARVTTGALVAGHWRLHPATSRPVERTPDGPAVDAHFPRAALGDDETQRSRAWLRIMARALPGGRLRRIETAPLRIPAGARLELGFGLLAESEPPGPVAFALSACQADACTPLLGETLTPEAAPGWHDRSLSLAAFAGREMVLRFETRDAGQVGFRLPVWSDPVLLAPRGEPAGTNVLLVSLDTLRADHLPSYGYPRDTAPHIEQLARRGVLFERAFSAASTTGPSHMTAFTARNPSVHGLRDNILTDHLPPEIPTLAMRLREAGYATGAVTENGALAFGSGIERGFESYLEFRTSDAAKHRAETTFAAARAWIDRHPERPFLLFVHTYETHTPYRAPEDTPPLAGPPAALFGEHAGLKLRKDWQPESYDHEIRYVDAALAGFLDGLERAGLLDHTLLVLFSDHGEAFLEHGYLHHGGAIHDEVLRVPLLFVGADAASGRRVSQPVGLVDLLPTLLELLSLPPVEGVMGRSFAPLVRGGSDDAGLAQRPIFSEAWARHRVELVDGRIRKRKREPPALAVRVGPRKLIREAGPGAPRYAYYDLDVDPGEQRDLYPESPEAAADLRAILEDYAQRHLGSAPALPSDDALDPEREEALRALGYLE